MLLIQDQALFDETVEKDMRRWWRNKCKLHHVDGELLVEVGEPRQWNLYQGAERLISFGVRARVVNRKLHVTNSSKD